MDGDNHSLAASDETALFPALKGETWSI